MTGHRLQQWDDHRLERLEKLIAQGLETATLAIRFGCDQATIRVKARELEQKRGHHRLARLQETS
jgi:hypothetical protein